MPQHCTGVTRRGVLTLVSPGHLSTIPRQYTSRLRSRSGSSRRRQGPAPVPPYRAPSHQPRPGVGRDAMWPSRALWHWTRGFDFDTWTWAPSHPPFPYSGQESRPPAPLSCSLPPAQSAQPLSTAPSAPSGPGSSPLLPPHTPPPVLPAGYTDNLRFFRKKIRLAPSQPQSLSITAIIIHLVASRRHPPGPLSIAPYLLRVRTSQTASKFALLVRPRLPCLRRRST